MHGAGGQGGEREQDPAGLRDGRPGQQPHRVGLDQGHHVADRHGQRGHEGDRQQRGVVDGPQGPDEHDRRAEGGRLGDGGEVGRDRQRGGRVGDRGPGVEGHGRELEAEAGEHEDGGQQEQHRVPGGRLLQQGGSGGGDPQRGPEGDEREGDERGHEQGDRALHAPGPPLPRPPGVGERHQADGGEGGQLERDEQAAEVTGGRHGRGTPGRPEDERGHDRCPTGPGRAAPVAPGEGQDGPGGEQRGQLEHGGEPVGGVEALARRQAERAPDVAGGQPQPGQGGRRAAEQAGSDQPQVDAAPAGHRCVDHEHDDRGEQRCQHRQRRDEVEVEGHRPTTAWATGSVTASSSIGSTPTTRTSAPSVRRA